MGMGEPAHNLDNVLEAIELLGTAGNTGHKNLVFSTVGDPRVFEKLPQVRVKAALALSLHTTKPELRQRPSWERAAEIAWTLHRRGVLTKLRQSAGQDADGGCGQLRARATGTETRTETRTIAFR